MFRSSQSIQLSKTMELYKFVKSQKLPANHTIYIHSSTLDETSANIEISGGALFNPYKSIISINLQGSYRRLSKKLNAVDITHTIEGDQVPRIVYIVYRLGQVPKKNVEAQRGAVDRLFYEKNIKRHHRPITWLHQRHYKSVDQQFMFFACIDQEDDDIWPDVFLVTDTRLVLNNLEASLGNWHCISAKQIKNSNVFIKLNQTPASLSNGDMIMYGYLNSIRKMVCKNCSHVWTLADFMDLLICKQMYEVHTSSGNDSNKKTMVGYYLQKKLNQCTLWTIYLPQDAFGEAVDIDNKSSSNNSNNNFFLLGSSLIKSVLHVGTSSDKK